MALHNVTLEAAIDEYIQARTARKLAVNTVRSDQYILKGFLTTTGNIYLRSVEPRHIDGFFAAHADYKDSTRNMQLTRIRAFFLWAMRRGYIKQDPTLEFRRVRLGTPEDTRLFVPLERFDELLDAAGHPRDRVSLALGLYLFLRVSELSAIKVGDVDLDNGEIRIHVRKTKDFDVMPICQELDTELRTWLAWYASNIGRPLERDMFLVPAKSGRLAFPATPSGKFAAVAPEYVAPETPVLPYKRVSRPHLIVQRALAEIGYDAYGEGGHTLRRSGARALFNTIRASEGAEGALQQVKVMLHHKNVSMTEHYLGVSPERVYRDARLKGRPMFARTVADRGNVVEMRRP